MYDLQTSSHRRADVELRTPAAIVFIGKTAYGGQVLGAHTSTLTISGLSTQLFSTTPNVAARATDQVSSVWTILCRCRRVGHVVASKVNCHFWELDEGSHFSTVRPRLACCELSTHKSWLMSRSIESSNRHFYKYVQRILISTLLREMQQVHVWIALTVQNDIKRFLYHISRLT